MNRRLKWWRKEPGWYMTSNEKEPTIEQSGLDPSLRWEVFLDDPFKPVATARTLREAKQLAQKKWNERTA